MAGTIITDRIESDASYASSVNIASPLVIANTISLGSAAAITGNVNIDNGVLFVDGVNNRVGVGTQNPIHPFHVELTAADDSQSIFVRNSSNGVSRIGLVNTGSSGNTNNWNLEVGRGGSRNFAIRDNLGSAETFRIDNAGRIFKPLQPAFRIRKTIQQTIENNSADIKVTYDTADTNIGSHYNTTTSRFTAPVTGWYHFHAFFMYNSFPTNWSYSFIRFLFNGSTSNSEIMYNRITSGQDFLTLHASTYYYMSANDYVEVYARLVGGSSNATIRNSFAEFQGMLIG